MNPNISNLYSAYYPGTVGSETMEDEITRPYSGKIRSELFIRFMLKFRWGDMILISTR